MPTPVPSRVPVTIVGSTGLTGSSALRNLLASPTSFAVTALTRKPAPATATRDNSYVNRVGDLFAFASTSSDEAVAAPGGVYISCLGTTKADAGGIEKQRKIDYELNRDLATRARQDGAKTMILVSTANANSSSYFAYPKMKGDLEDDIRALGFEGTAILQPAMLMYNGTRQNGHEARWAEMAAVKLIRGLQWMGVPTTSIAVEGEDVGAAIAQIAAHPPKGVQVYHDADIVRLANEFRESQKL